MSTYENPVFPDYFADPFVWKHAGVYYAVGTSPAEDRGEVDEAGQRRVFSVLRSSNLVQWQCVGKALLRPDAALGDAFWAPEVAFRDGTFFLYYSVGFEDKGHQLRVATSTQPAGPYRDVGAPLLDPARCSFAIDPHPFRDEDGRWYLFYARDFLEGDGGARPGTALVVRRLETMTTLEADEHVVLRARHEWQRFERDRAIYGRRLDWHTLEGPSVWRHGGRYYCFYSGGRWQTESYGVDYAVAASVLGPYSDEGAEGGARILRTVPGQALGPGHNSIVLGPDGVTPYLAYHAWDREMSARRMFLDRLRWTSAGPRCDGPTCAPQTVAA